MSSSTATPTDGLSDVVRWRARAEFFEVEKMLDYRDAEYARTASLESGLRMKLERSAVALAIGEATGLSEGQVVYKLAAADRVRSKAPAVWDAFGDGLIDFVRVRDISATIDQLQREESVRRLDATVIPFATTHTAAELRQWLRRFVQRVEADLAVERAEEARAERHVSVKHTDDSMAWLNAYLPSHEAAAIEAKIHQAARQAPAEDDDRTTRQREADLLVAWCMGTKTTSAAISANIAVTIGADVLAGFVPGFAESADGRWAVPADWITTVVAHGGAFWHRIVVDPITDDVLAHEYLGRFAPATQEYLGTRPHEPGHSERSEPGGLVRALASTRIERRGTSRARLAEGITTSRATESSSGQCSGHHRQVDAVAPRRRTLR
jgi:hypothetical protein